jgi:acyl-CoA reductase-like NAD-dependent aldehyde dehydrogenase
MCRMLYTLRHGAVVSKRAAALWAEGEAGGLWAPLIERAWEGRGNPRVEARPEDVGGTLDLIRYTLERARRHGASAPAERET